MPNNHFKAITPVLQDKFVPKRQNSSHKQIISEMR